MTIYEFPNITGGFDEALVTLGRTVPSFIIMTLVFVFGVVFLGGALSQQRRTGRADLPMWATVASLSTLLTALPMTLTAGILQSYVLSILVTLTIFSAFWLFYDRNRNEV